MDHGHNLTMNQTCTGALAVRIMAQVWYMPGIHSPHLEGHARVGRVCCARLLQNHGISASLVGMRPLLPEPKGTTWKPWPHFPSSRQGRGISLFSERELGGSYNCGSGLQTESSCPNLEVVAPVWSCVHSALLSEPASQFPRIPDSLGSPASKLWNWGALLARPQEKGSLRLWSGSHSPHTSTLALFPMEEPPRGRPWAPKQGDATRDGGLLGGL